MHSFAKTTRQWKICSGAKCSGSFVWSARKTRCPPNIYHSRDDVYTLYFYSETHDKMNVVFRLNNFIELANIPFVLVWHWPKRFSQRVSFVVIVSHCANHRVSYSLSNFYLAIYPFPSVPTHEYITTRKYRRAITLAIKAAQSPAR